MLAPLLCATIALAAPPASQAIEGHQTLQIEGWTVHVSKTLQSEHPQKTQAALDGLGDQLKQITELIPSGPLAHLRQVPLWLSPVPEGFGAKAEYHPQVDWLRKHGRDPAMAKAVQFTNVLIFEKETKRMPMFVLHELAHAYHDRVLGFDHAKIKAAYERAVAGGKYEAVKRPWTNSVVKHYALTNHKEYFAEATEAYFGKNDFYPFHREQLKAHDPHIHDLLEEVWMLNDKSEQDAR